MRRWQAKRASDVHPVTFWTLRYLEVHATVINIAGVAVVASCKRCMLLQVNGCRCWVVRAKQLLLGDSLHLQAVPSTDACNRALHGVQHTTCKSPTS
jgi:hypothetical protein